VIKSIVDSVKLRNQTVEMYNLQTGEILKVFKNVSNVYPYFNKKDNGYISQVLKGNRKSAWGYGFRYKDIKL